MINGFTLHDTPTAPAASTEVLDGVQKSWGFVPNLHRVLDESPAALLSNHSNHLAETPNDSFMKGAEWTPPGKLKPAA
jgi:hypothetical protein